jgi:phosphoglycerate dehydrogenase-like enzyme
MPPTFRVGVTRDFLGPDGRITFGDVGLSMLDGRPGLSWEFLPKNTPELGPDQVRGYDALLVLGPRVTAATLEPGTRLAIIARFGVGYDSVDVEACSRNAVLLTITPDGVRRPVAVAAMTLILALAHKLLIKDRLTREGRWSEKLDHMGMGLTGRTLGVIGLGNIGRELCVLARPFGMRLIGFDPNVTPEAAQASGAELVPLEPLLRAADFVCVCCALTAETRHLLSAERIELLKPSSYVINVARGPIIDQAALTAALARGAIQGAGLDVFEAEPVDPADPILKLDNVILAPHALCWTDECFRGNGVSACQSILEVAAGRVPAPVVNREVIGTPELEAKLRSIAERISKA